MQSLFPHATMIAENGTMLQYIVIQKHCLNLPRVLESVYVIGLIYCHSLRVAFQSGFYLFHQLQITKSIGLQ